MERPEIDLYKAVEEMRRISKEGGTFAFKFRKWNRARQTGGELVTVNAAKVRPAAAEEQVTQAGHKLFFTDAETGEPKVCWQPLIVEFEGRRTILN